MKRELLFLCALAAVGCAGKNAPQQELPPAKQEVKAPPPPSQEEIMAKVKQAATPGPEHKALNPLVGTFKTESKFWMEPGKPPKVEKGTAKNEWVFGKRFLKQEFKGKFMGQPFQGLGYLGYDNVKKAYISTWMDSMGTGVMLAEGSFNAENKSLEMNSSFSCPLTGGERKARFITRIVNDKEFVDEMFDMGPDGKEFKTMEIRFKKQG